MSSSPPVTRRSARLASRSVTPSVPPSRKNTRIRNVTPSFENVPQSSSLVNAISLEEEVASPSIKSPRENFNNEGESVNRDPRLTLTKNASALKKISPKMTESKKSQDVVDMALVEPSTPKKAASRRASKTPKMTESKKSQDVADTTLVEPITPKKAASRTASKTPQKQSKDSRPSSPSRRSARIASLHPTTETAPTSIVPLEEEVASPILKSRKRSIIKNIVPLNDSPLKFAEEEVASTSIKPSQNIPKEALVDFSNDSPVKSIQNDAEVEAVSLSQKSSRKRSSTADLLSGSPVKFVQENEEEDVSPSMKSLQKRLSITKAVFLNDSPVKSSQDSVKEAVSLSQKASRKRSSITKADLLNGSPVKSTQEDGEEVIPQSQKSRRKRSSTADLLSGSPVKSIQSDAEVETVSLSQKSSQKRTSITKADLSNGSPVKSAQKDEEETASPSRKSPRKRLSVTEVDLSNSSPVKAVQEEGEEEATSQSRKSLRKRTDLFNGSPVKSTQEDEREKEDVSPSMKSSSKRSSITKADLLNGSSVKSSQGSVEEETVSTSRKRLSIKKADLLVGSPVKSTQEETTSPSMKSSSKRSSITDLSNGSPVKSAQEDEEEDVSPSMKSLQKRLSITKAVFLSDSPVNSSQGSVKEAASSSRKSLRKRLSITKDEFLNGSPVKSTQEEVTSTSIKSSQNSSKEALTDISNSSPEKSAQKALVKSTTPLSIKSFRQCLSNDSLVKSARKEMSMISTPSSVTGKSVASAKNVAVLSSQKQSPYHKRVSNFWKQDSMNDSQYDLEPMEIDTSQLIISVESENEAISHVDSPNKTQISSSHEQESYHDPKKNIFNFPQIEMAKNFFKKRGKNSDQMLTSLRQSYAAINSLGLPGAGLSDELIVKDEHNTELVWQQISLQNKAGSKEIKKTLKLFGNRLQIFDEDVSDGEASISEEEEESIDEVSEDETNEPAPKKSKEDNLFNLRESDLKNLDARLKALDDDDDEEEEDELEPVSKKKTDKMVRFDDDDDIEDDEDDYEDEEMEEDSVVEDEDDEMKEEDAPVLLGSKAETEKAKSSHENAREKISKLIDKIQAENLNPRSWELSGEVKGEDREVNSLLEKYVEADFRKKQPPINNKEKSDKIQSICLRRFKEKLFDDVVRKYREDDTVQPYRNLTVDMNERKTLMDVYEDKYQAAQNGDDANVEDIDPQVKEVQKQMNELFFKIDALAHFNFAPSRISEEIRIVKNMPSMRAEEVGPMASASANETLMAPEEVARHAKSAPKAKEERTTTDKERERRKKKRKQHEMAKAGKMPKIGKDTENPDTKAKGNKKSKKTDFFSEMQRTALQVIQQAQKTKIGKVPKNAK